MGGEICQFQRFYIGAEIFRQLGVNPMDYDAIQYTIAAIYTSLAEATAIATGKPVEQLSGYLLKACADNNAPAQAKELLTKLANGNPPKPRKRAPIASNPVLFATQTKRG